MSAIPYNFLTLEWSKIFVFNWNCNTARKLADIPATKFEIRRGDIANSCCISWDCNGIAHAEEKDNCAKIPTFIAVEETWLLLINGKSNAMKAILEGSAEFFGPARLGARLLSQFAIFSKITKQINNSSSPR